MQGASFLPARLRQKIEDDFPEITHGLIQRLWSNYLRPMPSISIVQFDPTAARHVPRHCEVGSLSIDGTQCQFRTVFATDVLPLELHRLEHTATGNGATLRLGLRLSTQGHLGEIQLRQLRLHFAGVSSISNQLYLSLKQQLKAVRLTPLTRDGTPLGTDPASPSNPRASNQLASTMIRPCSTMRPATRVATGCCRSSLSSGRNSCLSTSPAWTRSIAWTLSY